MNKQRHLSKVSSLHQDMFEYHYSKENIMMYSEMKPHGFWLSSINEDGTTRWEQYLEEVPRLKASSIFKFDFELPADFKLLEVSLNNLFDIILEYVYDGPELEDNCSMKDLKALNIEKILNAGYEGIHFMERFTWYNINIHRDMTLETKKRFGAISERQKLQLAIFEAMLINLDAESTVIWRWPFDNTDIEVIYIRDKWCMISIGEKISAKSGVVDRFCWY